MRAVLCSVLVIACTTKSDVLTTHVGPVTTCEGALINPFNGIACDFQGVCQQPSESDPSCCIDTAICVNSQISFARTCTCTSCADDSSCTFGVDRCTDSTCEACPGAMFCAACPIALPALKRNGCSTCECAPPSTCDPNHDLCGAGSQCYHGAHCAPGCAPDDAGCCDNECATPGCTAPMPLGCIAKCGVGTCLTGCVTDSCVCKSGTWECTTVCATHGTTTCTYP